MEYTPKNLIVDKTAERSALERFYASDKWLSDQLATSSDKNADNQGRRKRPRETCANNSLNNITNGSPVKRCKKFIMTESDEGIVVRQDHHQVLLLPDTEEESYFSS